MLHLVWAIGCEMLDSVAPYQHSRPYSTPKKAALAAAALPAHIWMVMLSLAYRLGSTRPPLPLVFSL